MARDQQQKRTNILVTGGAGYVGCHSVLLMLEQNYNVIVIDNCSNAHLAVDIVDSNGNLQLLPESLRRVEELAGKQLAAFYNLDLVTESQKLDEIFRRFHPIGAVVHFAALKSVSESINLPLEYYTNNLVGTINLLNTMKRHACRRLIFSSSATVYGLPQYMPVDEKHPVGANILNPYGRSKFMIEQMLKDLCQTSKVTAAAPSSPQANGSGSGGSTWQIVALRYFNPTGAHPSGYIGEHTEGLPNNLMPYVSQVSIGKRAMLQVFGNDFNTPDGTGVRDFIHIMDLASGHTHALSYLFENGDSFADGDRYKVFNLGTGKGYSVLELIKTFERVNNVCIPYQITARREGDAGEVYADASLASRELHWSAKFGLVEMCRDTYRWQSLYPDGFKSGPSKLVDGTTHGRDVTSNAQLASS